MENYGFKAEMKQLLNLIIHSLYTKPEIFLRELVSNSSDALHKIRFRQLTESSLLQPELPLEIRIVSNPETRSFSIEDTGVGMSREELIARLGTIASSGTLEFMKELKENGREAAENLIGKFGVGFYSVFMVTDDVTVDTRSAEPGSLSLQWKSSGEESYTIEEIEERNRGTKISFTLKEEYKDFAESWKVNDILRRYSNFVDFPIYVNGEKVNAVQALWHRKKDDIKEEELDEFYKFISGDFDKPLGHLHVSIEGNLNFKSLLFVPKVAPPVLFRQPNERGLHLYSSKVFIQDDAKDIMPDYLAFVRGVVDTEDLPLNVSREVTQFSPVMVKIRNVLTGKILSLLEDWAANDKEKYETFFKNFGMLFKTGINSDYTNKNRIVELLRFESSQTKPGEFTSLSGYFAKMDSDQKEIYYLSGATREQLERNPNLEYFRKNNIEVLLLTDPMDVFTVPNIFEYEGKKLVSIEKSDIELPKKDSEEPAADADALIAMIKEILGDKVEDVVRSRRLFESPASLVTGKTGMDTQTERLMQMMDKDFKGSKRILEINPNHELIKNLSAMLGKPESADLLEKSIIQIFEGALLIEGFVSNPGEFVARMNELLIKATK
ncbi:MAG: molecular chaperone HtpG [Chloroflexota bacterium]